MYGHILSCFIFLVLTLATSNVCSHILENLLFADLGHFWKLPIFTTHIQNLYSNSDINEMPDNQTFKQTKKKEVKTVRRSSVILKRISAYTLF